MALRIALVFLHGSGGSGRELRSYLEACRLSDFHGRTFRQVLDSVNIDLYTPTAPSRPYSPAAGEHMNVWFDRSYHFPREGLRSEEDHQGHITARKFLQDYLHDINSSSAGEYDYVILGGFSMGGGLSLHGYLSPPLHPNLGAVFCIGGFLVEKSAVFMAEEKDFISNYRDIPLIMMHGK
ncbi:hypothetical protein EON65_48460 [archaeon]|nr:MAG: hypothetical protein EON65_48460 [archaeon]